MKTKVCAEEYMCYRHKTIGKGNDKELQTLRKKEEVSKRGIGI